MKVEIATGTDLRSIIGSLATVSDGLDVDSQGEPVGPRPLRSLHVASLLLNGFLWMMLWLFIVVLVWTRLHHPEKPLDHNLVIFAICWGILYLFYIVEAFTSDTFKMLVQKKRMSKISQYIEKLKATEPEIKFIGQSFHFKGETADADPKEAKRRIRIFGRRKVVTATSVNTFEYHYADDASDAISEQYDDFDVVKFKFEPQIIFADAKTENIYYQKLEGFNLSNQGTDLRYQVQEVKKIPGTVKTLYGIRDEAASCFYSPFLFVITTAFLLSSWPHRALIQRGFGKVSFGIRKIVTVESVGK